MKTDSQTAKSLAFRITAAKVQEHLTELRGKLDYVCHHGIAKLRKAQDKQKAYYDIKRVGPRYKLDDLAMLKNSRKGIRAGSKITQSNWLSYKVVEVGSKGTYNLKNLKTGAVLKQTTNAVRLKKFLPELREKDFEAQENNSDASESAATKVASETAQQNSNKTEFLDWLTLNDWDILETDAWLNDKIMDAAAQLIANNLDGEAVQSTLHKLGPYS